MAEAASKTPTTTTANSAANAAAPAAAPATPSIPAAPAPTPQASGRGKANASQGNMSTPSRKTENASGKDYKYFTEISQMMFVFGEVQDPMSETVNLVEDIVKSQIIELVSVVCGSRDVSRA